MAPTFRPPGLKVPRATMQLARLATASHTRAGFEPEAAP